jgi:NADH dehydrogenase
VFGDGQYKLQPIYVDDLAKIAVEQGEKAENVVINAIGPETFTYKKLVEAIGERIGIKRPILTMSPTLGYIMGMIIGKLVGDIMITREEIEGLMEDLLYVNATPTGTTRLTDWIKEHSNTLGRKYTSELARRIDRKSAYKSN